MKIRKSILSMLLCLAVVFSMCFVFSDTAYAAGETTLSNGAKIENLYTYEKNASAPDYFTPALTSYAQDFTYYAKMPAKGTLFVQYAGSGSSYVYVKVNDQHSVTSTTGPDGSDVKGFCVAAAGYAKVTISVSGGAGNLAAFRMYYAAANRTVGTKSTFYLGSAGTNTVSTFKVKVPSTGYLKITADNPFETYSLVDVRTAGFKGWERLYSSYGYTTYVGVKKGTYTIKLNNEDFYGVNVKFVKVKETSKKTSKAKAATIKKKKLNKGVIVTNKKKAHWYKIKNPKKQKLTFVVNAQKISDGGNSGRVKVTLVYPDGKKDSSTVSPGYSKEFQVTYSTTYGKANKGTYYVKIESEKGGNGYYTLKWK